MSAFKIAKRRFDSIARKRRDDPHTFTLQEFCQFYGEDEPAHSRCCHYCSLSERQIAELISGGEIVTKRLVTRGRTMEVDRKDPEGPYSIANVVLCCYWCNNAKTDEFAYDEFLGIAKAFKLVWIQRLKKVQTKKSA